METEKLASLVELVARLVGTLIAMFIGLWGAQNLVLGFPFRGLGLVGGTLYLFTACWIPIVVIREGRREI